MSVLGIDLGNQAVVIAQAVRGGVDIILNENSNRLTPSLVSFNGNERFLGEAATTQVRTNIDNTITQIKRLIGKKYSESGIQTELQTHLNYKVVPMANDDIGVEVTYNDESTVLSATQVLAALMTKLKQTALAKYSGVTTPDAVFSVPAYFTDAQRHAVKDAAAIAGFNCLRVLNEGTAAALSYGIYRSAKREFPDNKETKVIFLDMGHAHFTATVAAFTNGSLRVLSTVSDPHIGGRDIDAAIAKHFAEEFKSKTGLDAWTPRKIRVKLIAAAEKAKIAITPYGVNQTPVSIECLMNDRDFSTKFTVEQMDALLEGMMSRMQAVIRQAMSKSSTGAVADLAAAELVGGGMRPRVVKRKAAEALGLPLDEANGHGLSTSMNLDECIARGCALACAILSPIFRVKPFEITDAVPYSVRVSWDAGSEAPPGEPAGGSEAMEVDEEGGVPNGTPDNTGAPSGPSSNSMVLFKAGDPSPLTRRITFRRGTSFDVWAEYDSAPDNDAIPAGHPRLLGRYTVSGVPADAVEPNQPAPRIRVDFRHDINGIFSVLRAELLKEVKEVPPSVADSGNKMDVVAPAEAAAPATVPAQSAAAEQPPASAPAEQQPKPAAKKRYKKIELPISSQGVAALSGGDLQRATSLEQKMARQDADIHATHDMRNSLEAYIYNTRNALDESLAPFGNDAQKETLRSALASMEEWLYGEGFDADKATYEAKLKILKSQGDPFYHRKHENEHRAKAGEALLETVEDFRQLLANKDGKYAHLTDSERDTVRAATAEMETWYRGKQDKQRQLELWQDPLVLVSEINERRNQLLKELTPIANKPVPAPVPPPAPAPAAADGPAATENGSQPPPATGPTTDGAAPAAAEVKDKMEVE